MFWEPSPKSGYVIAFQITTMPLWPIQSVGP